jgi:hypothetical protein
MFPSIIDAPEKFEARCSYPVSDFTNNIMCTPHLQLLVGNDRRQFIHMLDLGESYDHEHSHMDSQSRDNTTN